MDDASVPVHREVCHVLLVDDDDAFCAAHKRSLELSRFLHTGTLFRVTTARNGEQAVALVKAHPFDCVLLDYRLDGEDGLHVLERLLAVKPDLTVLLVTGAGSETTAVEAIRRGAVDYLTKGTLTSELLERRVVEAIATVQVHRRVELQKKQLIHAERDRVMLDTLGAVCHHIAQPATVLRCNLVALKRREEDVEKQRILRDAFIAMERICDILWRLQHLDEFRTETYIPNPARLDDILSLSDVRGHKREMIGARGGCDEDPAGG